MATRTENSPIHLEVLTGSMATHQGRMPGMPPTAGQREDHAVVDTPYMDDVAKNVISAWGATHSDPTQPPTQPKGQCLSASRAAR